MIATDRVYQPDGSSSQAPEPAVAILQQRLLAVIPQLEQAGDPVSVAQAAMYRLQLSYYDGVTP